MTFLASIIIPCGPDHLHLLPRAVASAEAQTVACEVIPVIDHDRRGPGWARNRGAEQASGLFLVFLDADDELEASFVQTLARAYEPGRYLYCDWWIGDGTVQHGPDCDPWLTSAWHPVTTLLPAPVFRATGGFDEQLPAIEDRDFYLHVRALGYCGKRVGVPLVRYHADGQRSRGFDHHPQREQIRRMVNERYVRRVMAKSCCGGNAPVVQEVNERQPGDVLAETLYAPATQIVGGRFYKRPFFMGQTMWVAREHVAQRPDLWRLVADPESEGPDIDTVLALANVHA